MSEVACMAVLGVGWLADRVRDSRGVSASGVYGCLCCVWEEVPCVMLRQEGDKNMRVSLCVWEPTVTPGLVLRVGSCRSMQGGIIGRH